MKVDLGIWSKLTWAVIFLGFVAGLGRVANFYLPLIRKNESMRRDIAELNLKIEREEETARNLKASIEALRRDPKAVERAARQKLGYAKPDETVIRFIEPATNNDQTPR